MSRTQLAIAAFMALLAIVFFSEISTAEPVVRYPLGVVGVAETPESVFNSRRLGAINRAWGFYLQRNNHHLSEVEKIKVRHQLLLTSYVPFTSAEKVTAETSTLIRDSAQALKEALNREIAAQRNVSDAQSNIRYLDQQLLPNLDNRMYFLGVAPIYHQPTSAAH